MNQDKSSQVTNGTLPKSVKVRTTCNACQQAKIRCSHEKPSCLRCQKHNYSCIYSISRRLGRPAKKKDMTTNDGSFDMNQKHPRGVLDKRFRGYPKKTTKKVVAEPVYELSRGLTNYKDVDEDTPLESNLSDNLKSVITEDASLHQDCFMDPNSMKPPLKQVPDGGDLSPDNWLQEFMSNPVADSVQERDLLDSLSLGTTKVESVVNDRSPSRSFLSAESQDQAPDCYNFGSSNFPSHSQCPVDGGNGLSEGRTPDEALKTDTFVWLQPATTPMENLPARAPKHNSAHNYVPEHFKPTATMDTCQYQCQCHEPIIRELIQVNNFASRAGPAATIDSILNCQRVLQQLSHTILQCNICTRTWINLLMMVVVSIDSLVTALDAILSLDSGLAEQLFAGYPGPLPAGTRPDNVASANFANANYRRCRANSLYLKTHVDACPLVIGGFCVPFEDKFLFITQMLYIRLSELQMTVRRIRLCTQEFLAVPAARGRLGMIMETDQSCSCSIRLLQIMTECQDLQPVIELATILDLVHRVVTHGKAMVKCKSCRSNPQTSFAMLPALAKQCLTLLEAGGLAYSITSTNALLNSTMLAFEQPLSQYICLRSPSQLGRMELDEKETTLLPAVPAGHAVLHPCEAGVESALRRFAVFVDQIKFEAGKSLRWGWKDL
ncbi:Zn(II)2Cys6 transcription factor domain-containing protein [Aspergillus saccharolyticus JOP 1030-1]|uniref:Zn(2)-C6 fungal-type domain-containing protein n=1 Tax=Aspergillus saccharolyticus JOP 1030-1 TaxID=1450539 RepID=A0A318ZLB9_9EURO|nr:hypothetical protein BP01DRAFT_306898 [Aspergillus saccharolyticus JOP 1030-1]PYH41038.1 hypothetical protein BP01DRAFT_306898 [Aspergillus saccharolyticus JOP 1030-1]